MASRLSEIPHATVLLLEAGIDETDVSDVPVMAGFLQLTEMDWKYKTEPQNSACLGMSGRVSSTLSYPAHEITQLPLAIVLLPKKINF